MVNKRIRQSESARYSNTKDIGRTVETADSRQNREKRVMVPIENEHLEKILAKSGDIVDNVLSLCLSSEPDAVLLRYVLDRILPRSASDAYLKERVSLGIGPLEQIDNVIALVAEQKLTPGEGTKIAQLIDQRIKVQQHVEILRRLESIEHAMQSTATEQSKLDDLRSKLEGLTIDAAAMRVEIKQ